QLAAVGYRAGRQRNVSDQRRVPVDGVHGRSVHHIRAAGKRVEIRSQTSAAHPGDAERYAVSATRQLPIVSRLQLDAADPSYDRFDRLLSSLGVIFSRGLMG